MTYLRLGIQFVLFVIYAICFGRISVNKYLNSGVIITRDEEDTNNFNPPGKKYKSTKCNNNTALFMQIYLFI